MKNIYLLRHGQTLFNLRKLNQGACDSPLTKLGIEQAKKAKKFFLDRKYSFDHYYCSTQERAEDTLKLITDKEYVRDKRIKERNCGVYEGTHYDITPSYFISDDEVDNFWKKAGGETFKEAGDRLLGFLNEIVKKEDHESVLIVSHGTVIRSMLNERGFGHIKYESQNCGLVHLQYENGKYHFVSHINTQEV